MKKLLIIFSALLTLFVVFQIFLNPFNAPNSSKTLETFVVSEGSQEAIAIEDLEKKGFIKSFLGLDIALTIKGKHDRVQAGGYYLSKNMNAWQVADKITGNPDMKWITFPEGLRKEQIGERLGKLLGWSPEELDKWNNVYTAMKYDNFEGVYFPDTYLIPVRDSGLEIANRMISRFNEVMNSQFNEFAKKDILWTTGIKIASLIQREAAGPNDMPLIAGVIWNRLEKDQKLQIDATIQYAKGKVGDKWWSVVTPSDIRTIDSPYNSYLYKGLPPHPISNPGISAINAVLNPQETDCIYYLHDSSRQIHCAVTYEEHVENIEKYLN